MAFLKRLWLEATKKVLIDVLIHFQIASNFELSAWLLSSGNFSFSQLLNLFSAYFESTFCIWFLYFSFFRSPALSLHFVVIAQI